MITIKQIEALYWIAELGSFQKAALRLNTTQSAISKRIQELELASGVVAFDRASRGSPLTRRGEELLRLGRQMLDLRGRMASVANAAPPPLRRLRLGVSELVAMTWLPRLVQWLRREYPGVILETEVDLSLNLFERLHIGGLDFIVIPETFRDPQIASVRIAKVDNAWMASSLLDFPPDVVPLDQLDSFTILSQGKRSGSGVFFDRWLESRGVRFKQTLSCNSLFAIIGLTIAGLGVGYIPRDCFAALVEQKKLHIVASDPPLPPVPYAVMYRSDNDSAAIERIARFSRQICDFSGQFPAG